MITSRIIKFLSTAALVVGFSTIVHAQATRTWVSGVGDDANPCSRTAPCKTFAGAISKTAACGEISVLDPGGFGAVTITKAITIDGTGTLAGILASLTTGVIINAAAADVITLRGISINGACNGVHGINILSAKTVNVEDCVIFRFSTGNGITSTDNNALDLHVRNSVIRDNTLDGMNLSSAATVVRATLDNVRLSGNSGSGLHARQGSRVTATRCVFAGNGVAGIFAEGTGGVAVANVSKSEISNNAGTGVQAGGGASNQLSVVRISDCELHQNVGIGASVLANGEIDSWQDNRIFGNGTDGCPSCQLKNPN